MALTAANVAPAVAATFDVNVENFTASDGIASAVIKVTNLSGTAAEMVFVDCVFMDKDQRALDIGKALINVIPPGQSAYDKASIPLSDGVQYVSCRVVRSR